MHEVSLLAALVDQIEELAPRENFDRVLKIRIAVGAWSGVESSCLEFCYPEVTRNTVLEGSELILEPVGIELECKSCGRISHPEAETVFCSGCQSGEVVVKKGKEFQILDLEVL